MFCDQCHWYTAGDPVCPRCGAAQNPSNPDKGFKLPEDVSVIDNVLPNLTGEAMPAIETEAALAPAPECSAACAQNPLNAPAPAPAPAYTATSAPRSIPAPAPVPPPPKQSKQNFKPLVIVIAGVVVLMLVLLIAETARERQTYHEYAPYYEETMTESSWAEDVQAGDVIYFGEAQWIVLAEDPPGTLLLLLEHDIYLHPDEIYDYLNTNEHYEDDVVLGGLNFTPEEFSRILPDTDGVYLFLLTPEEMTRYGIEASEVWDEESVPVRPAVRVNKW